MRRLTSWIRKALTRKIQMKRRAIEIEPSNKLVYGMYFAMAALASLTLLETVYLVVLQTFSSEIFAAINLVIGTILGALLGQKG